MTTLGVHGFGFPEPGAEGDTAQALYDDWAAMLGRPVQGFQWYSSPFGVAAEARALEHGFLDGYAYAYQNLAPAAAIKLAGVISGTYAVDGKPVDLVGHSLGSKVVTMAAALAPQGAVRRVLLLDGALIQPDAPMALGGGISVFNAVVSSDLVLSGLGARFSGVAVAPCIGQAGLGRKMPGWMDIRLDDLVTQKMAKMGYGWDIGASPRHQLFTGNVIADLRARGNHWSVYASGGSDPNKGNHPMFRAFLDGEDLSAFAT